MEDQERPGGDEKVVEALARHGLQDRRRKREYDGDRERLVVAVIAGRKERHACAEERDAKEGGGALEALAATDPAVASPSERWPDPRNLVQIECLVCAVAKRSGQRRTSSRVMSGLGQNRTFTGLSRMSGIGGKADVARQPLERPVLAKI